MNVLVYPSTHPHAPSLQRSLASILVPHYLPQIISPDVLAAPQSPWRTGCRLLVLLAAPDHHHGVRQYAEANGSILALGVNAARPQALTLALVQDTSILRLPDGSTSLHLSFPSQPPIPATVNHDQQQTHATRIPSASLSVPDAVRVLGRYTDDNALAGALNQTGTIALWSCAPPLPEQLLVPTLAALGLRFGADGRGPGSSLLPQLLLTHPDQWHVRPRILQALFPDRDLDAAFSALTVKDDSVRTEFPDEQDTFQFHFVRDIPPSSDLIRARSSAASKQDVKDVILTAQPLTDEQERHLTPFFSPRAFFTALDEFRPSRVASQLRMGDVLLYGEVVTSTQTMLANNPKLLRALPSPLLSLATKQIAGRGRGKNAWMSPAGSMLVSLGLSIPLKSADSGDGAIRSSNLVFIQYLFALAVTEACHTLDPANAWASKVKLKWPNDIYGEFPAEAPQQGVELRKLGGILVNTTFMGNVVDVVVGCGLNILNAPPVGALAQLEALARGEGALSCLSVERVTAAVLTAFERIWNQFLAEESQGFRLFMDRYTSAWLHAGQIVTLTTITPHTKVRIVGITPDHGLLRTEPLNGGQYIDLQPDGNGFDMLKGLIKTKTS